MYIYYKLISIYTSSFMYIFYIHTYDLAVQSIVGHLAN